MKQTDLGLDLSNRGTRKHAFLDEMERAVPWGYLMALVATHSPIKPTGRPPFPVESMLRIYLLRQWSCLSDLGVADALFGHMKVRYRGLEKNTQQWRTLFALSNLWMVRKAFFQGAAG